ncbi:MAG: hypothetical protein MJ223_01430 [Mycoplasmoidaceae bacterium]|nr:hypothetical protein [Mycoplasmoidaceae bacterium]
MLVVLAGCGVMFYFANVKNVPDGDNPTYPPVANPTNTFELVMLIGGGVIALVALVGAFLYY